MKRILTAAALGLLLTTTAHAGSFWDHEYVPRNGAGHPMCLVKGEFRSPSGTQGLVYMKWSKEIGLFIDIAKYGWSFAGGLTVPMSVSVDSLVFNGIGTTVKVADSASLVSLNIAHQHAVTFVDGFASGKTLTVKFKSGNEPEWVGSLAGSREAVTGFKTCVVVVANSTGDVPTAPVPDATAPVAPPSQPVVTKKPKDDGSI